MSSPAIELARALVAAAGGRAHEALDAALDVLTPIERAALAYDWAGFWARPEQLLPDDPVWVSHGYLTARRFGKTKANGEHVVKEAYEGRAMRVGFCAQNMDKTIEVMVHGDAGLIDSSPPWFKAQFVGEKGMPARVVWPNGAQAFPFTPEEPAKIRGPGTHLFWASELQSWPASKREEALFAGILPMNTLGYGRLIWDATPKKRHPVIRTLIKRAIDFPEAHRVVGGDIQDNVFNLGRRAVADLEITLGGTQRGREELRGEFSDEDDEALWEQEWIDAHRRNTPTELRRRILVIDPAISDRKGTDETGFVDLGLGLDEQVFPFADLTGTYKWAKWGEVAVKRYMTKRCDCIVVERNAGGDACAANIVAAARPRGIRVEVVDKKAVTRHVAGVIYVKEVIARESKAARLEPVAALYKAGRVSHVKEQERGYELDAMEELMVTWVPEVGGSPDRLDALGHGVWELVDLKQLFKDHAAGFVGIEKAAAELEKIVTAAGGPSIADMLGRAEWGSKL